MAVVAQSGGVETFENIGEQPRGVQSGAGAK